MTLRLRVFIALFSVALLLSTMVGSVSAAGARTQDENSAFCNSLSTTWNRIESMNSFPGQRIALGLIGNLIDQFCGQMDGTI